MRGRMLELPLKPLLHIAFVGVSLFISLVIFLSFLLQCLLVRVMAKQALLQFLGSVLACANCKCACFLGWT